MIKLEKATFAGGCFWCTEGAFKDKEGIVKIVSGYTGGKKENPTYEEVLHGNTGHVEAIQVTYDPSKITYQKLLDIFWRNINPTDIGGQFGDRGSSYFTAIFYHNETQKKLAEKSKVDLEKSSRYGQPIVTKIIKFKKFHKAEDYHQGYSKKNPLRYNVYKLGSGREQYLKKVWKN